MTEQEVKTGNELIALFMGAIYSENAEAWGFGNAHIWSKKIKLQGKVYKNLVWATKFEKELKYHSSWDWLMPVVEKIESLNFSTLIYHLPKTLYTTKIISGGADVVGVNRDTKIQSVFDTVIEFIKWYNANK